MINIKKCVWLHVASPSQNPCKFKPIFCNSLWHESWRRRPTKDRVRLHFPDDHTVGRRRHNRLLRLLLAGWRARRSKRGKEGMYKSFIVFLWAHGADLGTHTASDDRRRRLMVVTSAAPIDRPSRKFATEREEEAWALFGEPAARVDSLGDDGQNLIAYLVGSFVGYGMGIA